MAFDITPRTSQEYLNIKAGFTGALRTKQECWNAISGRTSSANSVIDRQDMANSYAGTAGRTIQEAANIKLGQTGTPLILMEAIRRL